VHLQRAPCRMNVITADAHSKQSRASNLLVYSALTIFYFCVETSKCFLCHAELSFVQQLGIDKIIINQPVHRRSPASIESCSGRIRRRFLKVAHSSGGRIVSTSAAERTNYKFDSLIHRKWAVGYARKEPRYLKQIARWRSCLPRFNLLASPSNFQER
jgi:hypothetical protein